MTNEQKTEAESAQAATESTKPATESARVAAENARAATESGKPTGLAAPAKPTKYFVDFENVHGAGLKGVDELSEHDEVIIIYSQAAETFHIEHAIDILKSKARVRFVEADAGTRNAADFQLIVALYGNMNEEFDYAIITGDGGFDAAIKMGERMGLPTVRRMANVRGDLEPEKSEKPKSRRTRRGGRSRSASDDTAREAEADAAPEEASEQATQAEAETKQAGQANAGNEVTAVDDGATTAAGTAASTAEGECAQTSGRTRRRRSGRSRSARAEATSEQGSEQDASRNPQDAQTVKDAKAAEDVKPSEASEPSNSSKAHASIHALTETEAQAGESSATQSAPSAQTDTDQASHLEKTPRRRPRRRKRTQDAQASHDEVTGQDDVAVNGNGAGAEPSKSKPSADSEPIANALDKTSAPEAADSTAETPDPSPDETDPSADANADTSADASDKISQIKEHLEQKDIQIEDTQLQTLAQALEGAKSRQDFYRNIIRIERQQRGRILYRQVRDCYDELHKILQ